MSSQRLLTLYLDTTGRTLVVGPAQETKQTLPRWYQGDVIPIRLWILEKNQTGGLNSPFSYINDSALSVKIALITPDPSTPTIHASATLTYVSGDPGYYEGQITLGSAIGTLLGAATSATCQLELEINNSGTSEIVTMARQNVTVYADGVSPGTPPADPPGDTYPTAGQISAMYVAKVGDAGSSIILTSPDGSKQMQLYLDNDGVFHTDAI